MQYKSDIEIAQENKMLPIVEIAEKLGINEDSIEFYGKYKAKINNINISVENTKKCKLVLVTAITPTSAGEGKTTTTVGLGDALSRLGKRCVIALREPSLGPVFGIKGGAAGGGYAQVVPMEDINLHFTGDLHAVTAANNLLCAMIDNHIYQGNELDIDSRRITFKRCMDMNDRQLRGLVNGMGGKTSGIPREDGFDITVASEIMAILCLSRDLEHLKENLKKIIIGYSRTEKPITCEQIKAHGAMAALLKDAIKPNLVQTLEHTPAFIHGGPFANIAHGCNSLSATYSAMNYGEYCVTEAGFGADLGAEKFCDIKCRIGGLKPDAVVIVATVRALKHHGGCKKEDYSKENLNTLELGLPNLLGHIENMTKKFGLPTIVAINRFPSDTENEINLIVKKCANLGIKSSVSETWEKGGAGGEDLAEKVIDLCENSDNNFDFIYQNEDKLKIKVEKIVKSIYGGSDVSYSLAASNELDRLEQLGYGNLPVCMAKTQYSFSDDPQKLGRPTNFTVNIKNVKVAAGAGFVVVYTGDILTMPGLPKVPSAENIDIDNDGKIIGLF